MDLFLESESVTQEELTVNILESYQKNVFFSVVLSYSRWHWDQLVDVYDIDFV